MNFSRPLPPANKQAKSGPASSAPPLSPISSSDEEVSEDGISQGSSGRGEISSSTRSNSGFAYQNNPAVQSSTDYMNHPLESSSSPAGMQGQNSSLQAPSPAGSGTGSNSALLYPPNHPLSSSKHLCSICGDRASGKHYGVFRYEYAL